MNELWRQLRVLLRRDRFASDLEEEMQSHLAMQAAENREHGMDDADARAAARCQFGNSAFLAERSRDTWGLNSLARLAEDFKYALRLCRRGPGFTVVALLTLAVGIAANTVIFSVVRAVLLAPLPYRDPGRIVIIFGSKARWGDRAMISGPNAADIRAQSAIFENVAITRYDSGDLVGGGAPEHLEGSRVTPNLFAVLGVQPEIGHALSQGGDSAIVLSHSLWQRRFGANSAVVGTTLSIGEQARTVIGVMPAWFHFPNQQTEYWIALPPNLTSEARGRPMFRAVARLKPEIAPETAAVHMATISARLSAGYPAENAGWKWRAVPITETVVGSVRPALLMLFAAVAMVMLIACANVANLLLARGVERQQELALRVAVGAGRGRLIRLLLTESLLLAAGGGLAGALLALWGVRALAPLYPPNLPRAADIHVNATVLAFTCAVTLATALMLGLLPAFRLSRTDLNAVLKTGMRFAAVRSGRARASLVVVQVTLAVVLVTSAGLLAKSFLLRTRVSGFDPQNVLTVRLSRLPAARVSSLLETVRAIPGVTSAAAASSLSYLHAMSTEVETGGQRFDVMLDVVTPDLLRTLRIPLRQGRAFTEADSSSAPPVAIVNETMARRLFAGASPLGRQFISGSRTLTVVGVSADVPYYNLDVERKPAMYLPYQQFDYEPDLVVVRTALAPSQMASVVRAVIQQAEPATPILRIETVQENLSGMVASDRFYTLLLGLFAVLALGLAVLGVYGVVSFAVSLRTHEIGVRMALGATRGEVLQMVLRHGLALGLGGSILGVATALAATRVLAAAGLLFRVKPRDPVTLAAVPLVLIAAALAACWLPARRATRVDPMEALRYE